MVDALGVNSTSAFFDPLRCQSDCVVPIVADNSLFVAIFDSLKQCGVVFGELFSKHITHDDKALAS